MSIKKYLSKAKNEGRAKIYHSNNIDYWFITETDGWISIIETNSDAGYLPLIQACNIDKALDYITLREKVNMPLIKIG